MNPDVNRVVQRIARVFKISIHGDQVVHQKFPHPLALYYIYGNGGVQKFTNVNLRHYVIETPERQADSNEV